MKINVEGAGATKRSVNPGILVVDHEDAARNLCRDVISDAGLLVQSANTTEQALAILDQHLIDIVITGLRVPELGGIELLKRVRKEHPETMVMVLTQYGTIESALEATKLGATDYLAKPFHVEDLWNRIDNPVRASRIGRENRVLREQLRMQPGFYGLVGVSPKMERVYRLVEKVSQHNYPVLILGETGTGKELVARSIHSLGQRRNKTFVPVDCSTLVATLIESELFGYVKGAFTGALHSKQGLLESANGGTLFLDEIGDMPVDLQAKLLRVLQEKEVRPVGSTERISISTRVVAATNRELENAVRAGTFRQDLYYRLNVVQIKLPPLRERKTDIPLLVNTFLEKFSDPQRPIEGVSEGAMAHMMAHPSASPGSAA